MSTLNGKIAVFTGGNCGIGLATAKKFVEEGANVFITGRRQAELDKAVSLIGKNVTAIQGDVTNHDDLDRIAAAVSAEKGVLDVIVSAGKLAPVAVRLYLRAASGPDGHYDKCNLQHRWAALQRTAQSRLLLRCR